MAYVGTPLDTTNAFQSLAGKRFSGDASTTDFTLDSSPNSTLDIEVFVENVRQDPNSAYTVSGTTLGFTAAPPSGTNNIYVVHQAKAVGTIDPAVGSTLDLNGAAELVLDADADTAISADAADDQIDIKIGGNDDFKLTAKTLAIGGAAAADTMVVFDGNAVDYRLGIDDSADAFEIGIGSTHATTPQATFNSTGVVFNEAANDYDFRIETSGNSYTHMVFVESGAGEFNINDSAGEGTITFNQAAEDGFIISLKSSDVAHSVTGEAQADTYLRMAKYSATQGGGAIVAYGEGGEGLYLQGVIGSGQGSTAKSTSAGAPVIIKGTKESSNAAAAMASNENCAVILNHTNTRFIFDAEGDFHADSSSTTFDAYDDAQLVRAYDLSHGKGVINSKFDKFVAYNHEKLAELQLVGREENGTPNHFVNVTGMQRLHNGAIWQQYEKHNQLLEAVYDLAKEAVGEEKANAILDKHEVKRLQ